MEEGATSAPPLWNPEDLALVFAHGMGGWRHPSGQNVFLPNDSRYVSFDAEGRITSFT